MDDVRIRNMGAHIRQDLQAFRSKYNLSREDIASRLGICVMTVYRWERGESFPRSRFLIREFEKFKRELERKNEPQRQIA